MFEKYEALAKARETLFCLADEACKRMLEAETPEDVIVYGAQHSAFLKAAAAIHDQIMKELKQL